MVKQYPHYLFIESSSESFQDTDGSFVECEVSRNFLSMCREESNGGGSQNQVAGGDYHKSSSLIQLPKSCPKVDKGTKIIVANDPECVDIRIEGEVLNFDKTQLHSRLWV